MIFRYSSEASVILAFFSRVTNRKCFYSEGFKLQQWIWFSLSLSLSLSFIALPPIVCPSHREDVSPLYPTPTQPMDQPLDKPSITCYTPVAWLFLVCQSNCGARHDAELQTEPSESLNWRFGKQMYDRESTKLSLLLKQTQAIQTEIAISKIPNTYEWHLQQSRDIFQTNQTSSTHSLKRFQETSVWIDLESETICLPTVLKPSF